jgi:hypothetical protein
VDALSAGPADRGAGPRAQDCIFGDERSVEVAREGRDTLRKLARELYGPV